MSTRRMRDRALPPMAAGSLALLEEVAVRVELSDRAWLHALAAASRALLDTHGRGLLFGAYRCDDASQLWLEARFALGLGAARLDALWEAIEHAPTALVARTFGSGGLGPWSELDGFAELASRVPGLGLGDVLALHVVEADGSGLWFAGLHEARVTLDLDQCQLLVRARRLIAAGYRLRQQLANASASRRSGSSERGDGRRSSAVRRTRMAGSPSSSGVRPLAPDQWSLLDVFERDGRVYALSMQRGAAAALGLLTQREREVVERALAGRENKAIAYDLGLADATVRVLLARASAKLGAHSRRELLEKFAQLLEKDGE